MIHFNNLLTRGHFAAFIKGNTRLLDNLQKKLFINIVDFHP